MSCSSRQRPVRGAEVDGLLGDLLDAAAAADRLIVEAHGRIDLDVLVEPLRIDRVRESRPGAVELHLRLRLYCQQCRRGHHEDS